MKTDALARRIRFAAPAPLPGENIYPQDTDLDQWEAISHHGVLPISYLALFGKTRNHINLQKRYTRFYNLDWLARPKRQCASFHARYSPLVYDLTPKAAAALGSRQCPLPAIRVFSFAHQLMQSCFTASVELLAQWKGLRFVCRHEVLAHPAAKLKTLRLELASSTLVPDDLFAIERPDGKRKFYLLEADRNTETIRTKLRITNTWEKKIANYDEMLRRGLHKSQWGFPNIKIITVTTNEGHAEELRKYVKENSKFADYYTFLVEPTFGEDWRVPKELLQSAEALLKAYAAFHPSSRSHELRLLSSRS